MAYDAYQLIRIVVDEGICRATINNPPIDLLGLPLVMEIGLLAEGAKCARASQVSQHN